MTIVKYRPTIKHSGNWAFGDLFKTSVPGQNSYPAVNAYDAKDRYIIEAEIPGYDESQVEITVHENTLTISSKDRKEEDSKYLLRERRTGGFKRSFLLPKDGDREKITASYKNGLLSLVISKRPEAAPRNITINEN